MRYRLRTLLILLAIGPPLLAPLMVWGWREYIVWRNLQSDAPGRPEIGYLGGAFVDAQGGGVTVSKVRPGCAAEAGGVIAGDVITAINNRPCRDVNELFAVLGKSTVGTTLTMVVSRGGQQKTVRATLERQPPTPWLVPAVRIPAGTNRSQPLPPATPFDP
jgi:C-terminal processing protease CtpA/Prc